MAMVVLQAAVAADISCRVGEMGGGDLFRMNATVANAADWCRNKSNCAGFTAIAACTDTSSDVLDVHFKDPWGAKRPDKNSSWSNWVVPGPRPPPPPPPSPPIPPNPCSENITNAPQYHITNLGVGPHDLNAIFFYRGVWHLMHQANWTDWAHLVSFDLARWTRLPSALSPNGDWDGALTIFDGKPVIMYDCFNVPDCRPSQPPHGEYSGSGLGLGDPAIVGIAWPENDEDQNLTRWKKDPHNPIVINGAHGGYAGPSGMWKNADGKYNMLMPLGHVIARYESTDSTFHNWSIADPEFYPTASGPAEFFPLNTTDITATDTDTDSMPTHVLSGIVADKPYRGGTPWYSLGTFDSRTGKFNNTTAPAPLDSSDVVIFAQLGRTDEGRMLFAGWFNVGSSTLTAPREVSFDAAVAALHPSLRRLQLMPVRELADLRGPPLGEHGDETRLPAGGALAVFDGANRSTAFDVEFEVVLPVGQPLSFSAAVMAASAAAADAEVLLRVNVSAPFHASPASAGGGLGLRNVSATAEVPLATNPAYNSTLTFTIPDSDAMAVRILADRVLVEMFLASGYGAVSTPVLAPGRDPQKSGVFILSNEDGEMAVKSASAWPMGCGWAKYP